MQESNVEPKVTSLSFWAGIDWGSVEHAICVLDTNGDIVSELKMKHDARSIGAVVDQLLALANGQVESLRIGIETSTGPLVETLLARGLAVHSINPKQLDRFRDRFSPSGAKDDRRDARVIADALRTDARHFRSLHHESETVLELRRSVRHGVTLKRKRVEATLQLRDELGRYYSEFLALPNGDLDSPWLLALWHKIPNPAAALKARPAAVTALLRKYRIRRVSAEQVLGLLRTPPIAVARGSARAAEACAQDLVEQIELLNHHVERNEGIVAMLVSRYGTEREEEGQERDVALLSAMPGVGKAVLSTLIAEASGPLRDRNYDALRLLCGVAPVTKQSGKAKLVSMRRACSDALRDALFYWAGGAIRCDAHWMARFRALRAKGHSLGRAYRTIGDALLRVACALLRTQHPYDPALKNPLATT